MSRKQEPNLLIVDHPPEEVDGCLSHRRSISGTDADGRRVNLEFAAHDKPDGRVLVITSKGFAVSMYGDEARSLADFLEHCDF